MAGSRPILVVENDEDDIFFVKRAMQKAGIRTLIEVVETGEDAVAYLKGEGVFSDRIRYPVPLVLLLDLKLRGVHGPDVLRWIRRESAYPALPVIVVSSSLLAADVAEAYRCGANSYILKSADPTELVELMRDFARWWLGHNISPL